MIWLIILGSCFSAIAMAEKQLGPAIGVSKHIVFQDFRPRKQQNEMKLLGCATVQEDSGFIQIPAPPKDPEINISFLAGRALYKSPIRFMDPGTGNPASFQTSFSFQIDPAETQNQRSQGGSGLTFIIVPDEVTVGRPGPWLAMLNDACQDDYKVVAVEFDTFRNEEFGDPNDNHVGINLGSIVSNATVDTSDAEISFKNGSAVRAWINYNGDRRWIQLGLGLEHDSEPRKMIYSAPLDLSGFLKEYMFVGFSASTGHHTQIHSIRSWEFNATSKGYLHVPSENTCQRKLFLWGRIHRKPSNAFLVFVAVVVLCSLMMLSLYCNRKRSKKPLRASETALLAKKKRPRPPNKPGRFRLSELSFATRCFSEGAISGCGMRGVVFKGDLKNGSDSVAIKRFWPQLIQHSGIERRKIMKEISNLCKLRHPNLVNLRGWCNEKKELVLIYDYMANGSLDKWLFTKAVLSWSRRVQVIKDIAQGLCFMHKGWEKSILHKNVKISNVLLDISFSAALGDFGLFRKQDKGVSNDGLLASLAELDQVIHPPELDYIEIPNEKMDVFGFGVVVLETLSGRKSLDKDLSTYEANLVQWAWTLYEKGELIRLIDKRLGLSYNPNQALRMAIIALLCTTDDPCARPSMEEIILYINEEKLLPQL